MGNNYVIMDGIEFEITLGVFTIKQHFSIRDKVRQFGPDLLRSNYAFFNYPNKFRSGVPLWF